MIASLNCAPCSTLVSFIWSAYALFCCKSSLIIGIEEFLELAVIDILNSLAKSFRIFGFFNIKFNIKF